eukprot:NODE_305_length_1931_cov_238.182784_g216_i0.p1 GENE.NODE_305_length_1931_cov_238.182784_g216_i0~~NODE_305_length_1931_cov_238.182784_g216_i0.p1  ORF type:complete len:554 (+),score=146.02 NODE_305_length_1931_cov_238.182784_g216_i0:62-1723(+)
MADYADGYGGHPAAYGNMDGIDNYRKPLSAVDDTLIVEVDYRLFRYSKFALPWVLLMLLCFTTLFILTFWQGGFAAVKRIDSGIPRDLEPWADDSRGDGGLARSVRNLRVAVAFFAIFVPIWIAVVKYAELLPKKQKMAHYIAVVLLIIMFIMAAIAFCIDVTKTDRAEECQTEVRTRLKSCENKSSYAVAVTALDLAVAVAGLVSAIMIILWTKDGTFVLWRQKKDDLSLEDPGSVEVIGLAPYQPGLSHVHKSLITVALLVLFFTGILLLIFTIFIHEFRERVNGEQWDPISKQMRSGWPKENSRLRLAATIIGIGCCLLSVVPYRKRVYVYVLAFFFLISMILHFVAFGLDVKDVKEAKDLKCPTGVECIYHPYHATVLFDFINALLLLIFIVYEHIFKHKASTVNDEKAEFDEPLDEYNIGFADHPEYAAGMKYHETPAIAGPPMRPILGLEVLEIADPAGADLHVTVINVTQNSAAEEAGIKIGDIIIKWDEFPIACKDDFATALSHTPIGNTVVLQVLRTAQGGNTTIMGNSSAVVNCHLTIRGIAA